MSKPSFSRKQRLEQQIKKVLGELLLQGLSDPRLSFLSVTHVELSNDLKIAWVYYTSIKSVQDEKAGAEAQKALKKATSFIRREFAKRVNLKYIPEFRFEYDKNIEHAIRIDQILKKLHNE